ncbi:MAG: glycerophosphodiester phosphodiesterase family protein [Caulobacterales bacterium]|nr:glycerophosphodiester phosphodiesterase family protein [Caulobacterales bacterium]
MSSSRTGAASALILAAALAACGPTDAERMPAGALTPGEGGLAAFLGCLDDRDAAIVSAHRGGPAPGYPENALATFARTLAYAPAIIETDIRMTADGELVLLHDEELDRTTTCSGRLHDTRLDDLAACRLRDPDGRRTDFAVPRLADALAWSQGRTILQLDIKRDVRFEDVIAEVRAAGAEERVILITYSLGAAARIARLAPELTLSISVETARDLDDHADRGVDLDRTVAWTGTDAPDPALNAALERRGVPAVFGALGPPSRSIDGDIARRGDEDRYAEIAADGVDILATDRPRASHRALAARNDPRDDIAACQGEAP